MKFHQPNSNFMEQKEFLPDVIQDPASKKPTYPTRKKQSQDPLLTHHLHDELAARLRS